MSEKTNELMKKLYDGVEELFVSEKWTAFLKFCASFHRYSANNLALIYLQRPDASFVCSYSDWRTQHSRQVRKGSRAIKVICPHLYKRKDGDDNEEQVLGYHVASVFDVSDTEPAPNAHDGAADLPLLCRTLDNTISDRDSGLVSLLIDHVSPVPVDYEDIKSGAHGYYSMSEMRIVIDTKIQGTEQEIKTLLHEIMHAYHLTSCEEEPDARTAEVIAESAAFIVCSWLGLDSSMYSMGYVCSWSSDKTHKELTASLDTIRNLSEDVISRIEKAMMSDDD